MDLQLNLVPPSQRKTPPQTMKGVTFGSIFTDHMFVMNWEASRGWYSAKIEAYQAITLEPSAIIFHYGQEVFEGMKAYHTAGGKDVLFRPQKNFERFNKSSKRMCLPEIDGDFVLTCLKELLKVEQNWIPHEEGASLYIRPTLIGTQPALGLRVSSTFLFFIIMCPVASYYPEGFNPVKIVVSETYTRAAPGGVGEAKTAGNYAASSLAEKEAKENGFTQVLWLDAVERKYVEEVGSMNIFFVIDDEIITPALTGTILPGITRMSVLELGKRWGLKMVERRISIEEIVKAHENGRLREVFGSGTAAVISPVGSLSYRDKNYLISEGKTGPVAQRFFDEIVGIQYGRKEDPFQWIVPIK